MSLKSKISFLVAINLCLTPLIVMPFCSDRFNFPKIFVVYIVILCAGGLCVINKDNPFSLDDFSEKLLYVYFMLVIISTINSSNINKSLWGGHLREEGLFALIAYGFLFLISKKYYQVSVKHLKLFIVSAFIIALYGTIQYFGFDPIPRDIKQINWYHLAFSTIGNPNFFGSFLVLVLPICSFLYIYLRRPVFLVTSSVIYLALLCSNTRGAWLGGATSVILLSYFVYSLKFSKRHLFIILTSFFLVTVSMNFYSNGALSARINSINTNLKGLTNYRVNIQDGGSVRIYIWEKVVSIIEKHPVLGIGIDSLGDEITKEYSKEILNNFGRNINFDKAHNEYLNIAVSTGIPSLALYLCFVFSIVKKGFVKVRDNYYVIPVLCSIMGYLVQAFFNISVVSVAYIYWILLGVLLNFTTDFNNNIKQTNNNVDKSC